MKKNLQNSKLTRIKFNLLFFCFFFSSIAFSQTENITKENEKVANNINSNSFSLNTPSCDELIHYRDVELLKQYDDVIKKYSSHNKPEHDEIEDLKRQKLQLLNERGWNELMSTGTAISEGGVQIAQIAQIIKANCDLFNNLLGMMPGGNIANGAIKVTILTSEQVLGILEDGKDFKDIADGKLEETADKVVAYQMMGLGGKAVVTGLEFAQNLNEFVKIPEEREKLKSEVKRILDMIDNAIDKYEQDLGKNEELVNQKIQIVNGITKYLLEHHCKGTTFKKDTKNSSKNELDKEPLVNANNKKTIGNTFYIFLVTDIDLKPSKTLYIISTPLLHQGNLKDPMQDEKEQFITNIKIQLADKPDIPKELLEIDTKNIDVHLDKPYSTKLLKTKEDVFEAIEAYKKSMRDAIDGLGADPLEFLQIK